MLSMDRRIDKFVVQTTEGEVDKQEVIEKLNELGLELFEEPIADEYYLSKHGPRALIIPLKPIYRDFK